MSLAPETLNDDCACISLDRAALIAALDARAGEAGFGARMAATHPTLFSAVPVYLHPDHLAAMSALIGTIEDVARHPAYVASVLAGAPETARHETRAAGVLMGYDFHLGASGPKLIEINTNAGGALINAVLIEAQRACCTPLLSWLEAGLTSRSPEVDFAKGFFEDWRLERGERVLSSIAIIDSGPLAQFLYPEFVLFRRLLEGHGIATSIAAPEDLAYDGAMLRHGGRPIDLVYNRLTDFSLEQPSSAALRAAYLAGHVVLTPHPRVHALLADKRNLARLTDEALLRSWGIANDAIARLVQGIPCTIEVTPVNAGALWARRAELFFKPVAGYGSKAAYRGDKVTRRVWDMIAAGGYVAQELVAPSTRSVTVDGEHRSLKVDLRCYTYAGHVQLVAARLYQGQTTNMRTPGGGFAPVLSIGPIAGPCCTPVGACAGQ